MPGIQERGRTGKNYVERNGVLREAGLLGVLADDVQIDVIRAVSCPLRRLLAVTNSTNARRS